MSRGQPAALNGSATPGTGEAIDGFALRSCLARFGTGVAVVTVDGPNGRHGLTVNSFTAVSLEPPLVLIALHKKARGHDFFSGSPFGVNILGAEQRALAQHFAGHPQSGTVRWSQRTNVPRLTDALAYLDCAPWATYDGGDHTLFVGEVTAFDYRDGDALGYFGGRFVSLDWPVLGIEFLF
jgi:flavin reductase (DIM6/NTAB) family NADH-FMN oxidoreductase RutF